MIKEMVAFIQNFRSKVQKPQRWLLIIYLILAAYLVVDSFIYLLGPYSGRVSILDCTTQIENRTICTVTLYGIRETQQSHFWADEFRNASRVANFNLGDSAKATYGVAIMITTDRIERVDFVAPYQNYFRAERATAYINRMFSNSEDLPSGRFIYIGFDGSLYRRAFLLVVGLLFVLTYDRYWQAVLSCKTLPRMLKPVIEKGNLKDYAFSWWRLNFLFRIIFLFLLFFISGMWSHLTRHGEFTSTSCYVVLNNCEICSQFPISSFICLYPLIAYGTIQALIQWKLLNSEVRVSGLWVVAPALASFALVPFMTSSTCENCRDIKFLLTGLLRDWDIFLFGLIVYGLLVAILQWIAMQRSRLSSAGWILIFPLNMVLILLLRIFVFIIFENFHSATLRILLLLLWPLSLMLDDIIPAIYISWLIYRKNSGEISGLHS